MPKQQFSETADNPDLHKLADLLRAHRAELLATWRREGAALAGGSRFGRADAE
jgi:hypothetical protein